MGTCQTLLRRTNVQLLLTLLTRSPRRRRSPSRTPSVVSLRRLRVKWRRGEAQRALCSIRLQAGRRKAAMTTGNGMQMGRVGGMDGGDEAPARWTDLVVSFVSSISALPTLSCFPMQCLSAGAPRHSRRLPARSLLPALTPSRRQRRGQPHVHPDHQHWREQLYAR